MSTTSKSPRRVLVAAWRVAQKALSPYSHKCSPKKFTQHQLFASLVLKAFLNTDYRGLAEIVHDSAQWCRDIELEKVPHYTTFQKAARRLLRSAAVDKLLAETVRQIQGKKERLP